MRISAVSGYNRVGTSYEKNGVKNSVRTGSYNSNRVSDVSFKRIHWGGFIGSTFGTFAGLGIGVVATLATGGIAVPLILSCIGCSAGGIGGDATDNKLRELQGKETDDDDFYDDDIDNYHAKWG